MLLSQGQLDDADAEARSVIDLPVELGYPNRVALPLSVMVETALRRGNAAEADAVFAHYAAGARGVLPDLLWAAALVADARGDAAAAARALEPVRALLAAGNYFFANYQHHRLPQLVRITRGAGQEKSAAAFAAAVTTHAEQNPQVNALAAAAAHARALIDGDVGLLREAVERATASEDRLLEAAAREDLGRALTVRPEAIGQLETAYDFYLRIGAHRDLARVRSALRALGIRKPQGSVGEQPRGWASLTRAEQAVVDLVANGLTNREAASELFLSPDTINTHLRHAFLNWASALGPSWLVSPPSRSPRADAGQAPLLVRHISVLPGPGSISRDDGDGHSDPGPAISGARVPLRLQRRPELGKNTGCALRGLGHPVVPETVEPSQLCA